MAHAHLTKANATNQCVTLRQAKDYLYVANSESDALIERMIKSAQDIFEQFTDITIMAREHTVETTLCNGMELRGGYVAAITSVSYFDTDNVAQVFDVSKVYVDNTGTRAKLMLVSGESFPTTLRPVTIVYTAGVATDDLDCPDSVAETVLSILAFKFENRGVDAPIPQDVINQLNRHRTVFFG